ncbi:MAG: glycosyltransferase [Candidatus Levybacteria bacterium]|nr:glycosyltransferase [Candidatus Levybacteria bacterium]
MVKKVYSITIAIPVYNEEEALRATVLLAIKALEKLTKDYEILLVDDGSTDNTGKIADNIAAKNKRITVLHHKKNKGFTGAIRSCYRNASKELIYLAPGDGQVDFRELPEFLHVIRKGCDIAIGYRIKNPMSPYRKINSFLFHVYCRYVLGLPFKKLSTVILWKKSILDALNIDSHDRSAMIEPEVVYKAYKKGYKFVEIPFTFLPRSGGKAKGSNPLMILKTLREMVTFFYRLHKDRWEEELSNKKEKLRRSTVLQIVLTLTVGCITMIQILKSYFFNDDFSLLYNLHILLTPHTYPYHTIVPFFQGVYDVFQLNPIGYFLYGLFFFLLSISVFFLFCRSLFGGHSLLPFLATVVFATSPLGIGSNSSAITFSLNYFALILLLLILWFYGNYRKIKKKLHFTLAIALFGFSLIVIPFRAFLFIFVITAFEIFLISDKKLSMRALSRSFTYIFPFFLFTFLYYIGYAPMLYGSGGAYTTSDLVHKIQSVFDLQTLLFPFVSLSNLMLGGIPVLFSEKWLPHMGSIYHTRFEGVGLFLLFTIVIFSVVMARKGIYFAKLLVFSLIWMYVNILLYYVIATPGITQVTARHVLFSTPAYALFVVCLFILLLRLFSQKKTHRIVITCFFVSLIVINFLASLLYLRRYDVERSTYAWAFFQELQKVLPVIHKGTILYVITGTEEDKIYRGQNIFTAGYYGYEAAFAIQYGIPQENFRVVTTPDEAKYFLQQKPRRYYKIVGIYFGRDMNTPVMKEDTYEALQRLAASK